MLVRLFSRGTRTRSGDSPMPLPKGTPVVALRDLGECGQDFVCRGTTGIISAASRIATYEVIFDGQVTLTNLDGNDVRPCSADQARGQELGDHLRIEHRAGAGSPAEVSHLRH